MPLKLRIAYALTGLPLLLDACTNPLEGVQLRIKDPIQAGVLECRFYDPASNPLPAVNEISIGGPDADRVVTTLNTTRFKLNTDGTLLVAASPAATLAAASPFRFTVVVKADDYLTVVQPVVFTGPNRQTRYIRRINLKRLPPTLSAGRTTGQANGGQVSAPVSLTTTGQTETADRATLTVVPGIRLTDRDRQPVGGTLTLAAIHTNARTGDVLGQVPGGGVLSNVAGQNGGPALGSLRVMSMAGSVTFELYNEQYQLAKFMSEPLRWTMDLNPSTINATAGGRAIQVGDSIPLFSYDAFTNRWQPEKAGVVARNARTNGLEYRAQASHAAAYVACWTESVCPVGLVFNVSSNLASVDVNYLCQLVDATTNAPVYSFYANVNNGASIRTYNQVAGQRFKLRVFDETDAWGKGANGGLIAESGIGTTCNTTPVAINLSSLPVPPVMKLAFNFSCPGGTKLDESALPAEVRTQYSPAGKDAWRDLITATRTQRSVASYKLKIGQRYDFRASTDGGATWPLRQNDYLVDKPEWVIKIRAEMYCN